MSWLFIGYSYSLLIRWLLLLILVYTIAGLYYTKNWYNNILIDL